MQKTLYYPKLAKLADLFNEEAVIRLDSWLAKKKQGSYVVPRQVEGIPEKTALRLLIMCAQPDIGIMDIQYRVKCPRCKGTLQASDAEGVMTCPECLIKHTVDLKDIRVVFVLVA